MTAPSRTYAGAGGPLSESLQGRNPRDAAGCWRRLYGDFDATAADAAAVDVPGGVIAAPHADAAGAPLVWVSWWLGREAALGLARRGLGRALPWPALGGRDRDRSR